MLDRNPIKNGIALEGGGAKGAYQIGAWKAFMDRGITFQMASGASIGAINAALMIQGDFQAAMGLWHELSAKRHYLIDSEKLTKCIFRLLTDIGLFLLPLPAGKLKLIRYAKIFSLIYKSFSDAGTVPYLLREGLMDVRLLERILTNHLDLNFLLQSKADLYIFAYQVKGGSHLGKGRTSYIKVQDLDLAQLKSYLLASIAFPFILPSVSIGGHHYRDGDMELPDIISPFKDKELNRIYIVHSRYWKRMLYRNKSCDEIIRVIPSKNIGALYQKTFNFSPAHVDHLMRIGYLDTCSTLKAA